MRLIRFVMLVLIGLNSIAFAANTANKEEKPSSRDTKKSAKEDKSYVLRFAWWELPEKIPDLYILSGNKYLSVGPRHMSMSNEVSLNSEGSIDLLQKLVSQEKDNNGRPKESYEVYTSINLSQVDSRDLGILLAPNKQKNVVGARVFDFSSRGFPYGSFIVVNLTRSKIACTVDDSNFVVTPNGFNRSPKLFTQRTVASVGMIATDPSGVENQIVSTKAVFNHLFRTLYFIIPREGANKYDVRCIIDVNSNGSKSAESKDSSEDSKGKAPKS